MVRRRGLRGTARRRRVCCACPSEDNAPPPLVETAPWGYVRLARGLLGRRPREWARRLHATSWQSIYAYFMHEPAPRTPPAREGITAGVTRWVLRSPRLCSSPSGNTCARDARGPADPAIYASACRASLDALRERFRRLSRALGDGAEQRSSGSCASRTARIGYAGDGRGRSRGHRLRLRERALGAGLRARAVLAMIAELAQAYGVRELTAVLKTANALAAAFESIASSRRRRG